MKSLLLLLVAVLVSFLLLTSHRAHGQPQRASQRGRAISGFSRANEADYENSDEEEVRPKVRKYGRKGYRSNCRCSKLTNCPKLQITIPRCPPDEYICCF